MRDQNSCKTSANKAQHIYFRNLVECGYKKDVNGNYQRPARSLAPPIPGNIIEHTANLNRIYCFQSDVMINGEMML